MSSKKKNRNPKGFIQKHGLLSGLFSVIFTALITIYLSATSNNQGSFHQINNNSSAGIINTGQGDINITYKGLSQKQYNLLLTVLENITSNEQSSHRLLDHLLEQIDVKNIEINDLIIRVEEFKQKINELMINDSVSSEVKELIKHGKLDEAEELVDSLQTEVIQDQEKILAGKFFEISLIKQLNFKYKEALLNIEKAVVLQPINLGYLRQASYLNLVMGNYDEAIIHADLALSASLNKYDENHIAVATAYNNLGLLYGSTMHLKKALHYIELSLKIALQSVDEESREIATKQSNLGSILLKMGKVDEAIYHHKLTLKIFLKLYGKDDYRVATARNNLGLDWYYKGEFDKALTYIELALNSDLKTFGADHVAIRHNNLGLIWFGKGEYNKAIIYFELAKNSFLKNFGSDYFGLTDVYHSIGSVWYAKEDITKAIEYFELALNNILYNQGEKHPVIIKIYTDLGNSWFKKSDSNKAIDYFDLALKSQSSIFGEEAPQTAFFRKDVARVFLRNGEHDKAVSLYEFSLVKARYELGENNIAVATIYRELGKLYLVVQKKYSKSIEYLEKSLRVYIGAFGENSVQVANINADLALAFSQQGEFDKAIIHYEKSLNYLKEKLGEADPNTKIAAHNFTKLKLYLANKESQN